MKRKPISNTIANWAKIASLVFLQLTFIIGLTGYVTAQELNPSVISTGGETFTVSGYSLDFVIGELVTESYTEQGLILTQGFLQGVEEELGIHEQTIHADDIDVYPNPVTDIIYILCEAEKRPVRIEIDDLQGCMVYEWQFSKNPMEVSLKQLNPGLYVLKLIFPDRDFVSKKIIKK